MDNSERVSKPLQELKAISGCRACAMRELVITTYIEEIARLEAENNGLQEELRVLRRLADGGLTRAA